MSTFFFIILVNTRTYVQAMNDSTDELTCSLQEMTARLAEKRACCAMTLPTNISVDELDISKDVESFVERSRTYAEQTRKVSIGTY